MVDIIRLDSMYRIVGLASVVEIIVRKCWSTSKNKQDEIILHNGGESVSNDLQKKPKPQCR